MVFVMRIRYRHRSPDYLVTVALLALFLAAGYYTVLGAVYGFDSSTRQTGGSEEIDWRITAPFTTGPRPYKDGEVIVGRESFIFRILITAKTNISALSVIIDGTGTSYEGYNVSFSPVMSGEDPRFEVYIVYSTGETKTYGDAKVSLLHQENKTYVKIDLGGLSAGESYDVRVFLAAPEKLPSGLDSITIELDNTISGVLASGEVFEYSNIVKTIRVVNPPTMIYITITLMAFVGFLALIVAGYIGFFRIFSTTDLVSIAIIAAMQTIWVHIIGKPFFFPILNKIPLTYNFAVGDFPYIMLLIIVVMLIRKPGTVSLTLFVYNLSSQIMGFYAFNPAWWSYPISEGLLPDLWILLRGDAILTDKISIFKRGLSVEELESMKSWKPLKYIDGFMIGFMRGFTMQYVLYVAFLPYFYRISYSMGYIMYWMVIPWAIGNAVEGAISVPIAEKVRQSAETV